MRQEIANLVHPILAAGLRLQQRLARGESPSFEAEQATLVGLLTGAGRRPADFEGDLHGERSGVEREPDGQKDAFLGARYALICWLDEMFVLDSPWSERWNEHKLEIRLCATNDRAWRFWDQARLASGRPGVDALEVFFLCVMLGFSGELGEDPQRLAEWAAGAHSN